MASPDSGKYIRGLTKLKFRDKASIKLPKSGDASVLNRETCYKIAIDVIIESITKPEYRNFQTTPYHGFYGYATLVMRDCIAPKIQLQFGRNRIFEQRIVEAFQGWNDLAFYLQTTKRFLELLANSLRTGEPPSFINNLCDVEAFPVAWSEIDLREIYVLCPEKTQFRIELSWTSPEKFTDDCGKEQDGKSKEPDDPEKDDGLPADGTQPKKNDPANPWQGNTSFSPLDSSSPYFNPKGSDLNNPNPDNTAEPSLELNCYIEVTWTYLSNGVPVTGIFRRECQCDSKLIVEDVEPQSACAPYFNSVNRSAWVSIGDSNIKGAQIGSGCTIGAITAVVLPKPIPS